MDTDELEIHRVNTKAFIDYRPVEIALIPVTRTKTPSAGFTNDEGTARDPQTFRLIEYSRSAPAVVSSLDGVSRQAQYELLGEWNCTMEINDIWTATDGRKWTVGDIMRPNGYEVRGLVTEYGR